MVTNDEFLRTLFGEDAAWAHVCSFREDPSEIPGERRFQCWGGNYYSRTSLLPDSNQYFTISTFYADDKGKARRRKALFRATHVIVADDVREKLPVDQVEKLPPPTYKLETSPGSEQWGWVLDHPATDRHRVENLLDGLVARGLAPEGKDPGMKGVTRYVRLPEGVNTKASRVAANSGVPPRCRMLEWNPFHRVAIEKLAAPFGVDLDAERREARVDGAANVEGHPLLELEEIIEIKSVRSDGRFDIICPWVDEHTGGKDDGAAVFTNGDGSIGFKCHHGSCQHRTGGDLLRLVEEQHPGFRARLDTWKVMRIFGAEPAPAKAASQLDFMGSAAPRLDFMGESEPAVNADEGVGYQQLLDRLKMMVPSESATVDYVYKFLQILDPLEHGHRLIWHNQIGDHMKWSKVDIKNILDEQRPKWYEKKKVLDADLERFYQTHVYVAEQNAFFCPGKNMWLTPDAFHNSFAHINDDARAQAITEGKVRKVDRLDYAPGMPEIFLEEGVTYVNGWRGQIEPGIHGDCTRWLDHFKVLGWEEHQKHILQWMAYTLRHPERKINHMLVLGGGEGNGKDYILEPLKRALGRDHTTIDGDELLRDFNDYLMSTKYLHINESELGDRKEARQVANRAKPLAAAPPHRLRVNLKGIKPILVRNVVNCTMTSNSAVPLALSGDSRRYYAVWTSVSIRGQDGQMTPQWRAYWTDRWSWMRDMEGWRACVHYLLHQVDLSDFDPGAVPVVTDFVKEIQEASEDPIQSVLKEMINRRYSLLASDLLSSHDVHTALKAAVLLGYELRGVPMPPTIGKIMKQTGLGVSMRARAADGGEIRLWAIRGQTTYSMMSSRELYDSYIQQMQTVRQSSGLQLVPKQSHG